MKNVKTAASNKKTWSHTCDDFYPSGGPLNLYHLSQQSFGSSAFHCGVEMSGLHQIQFLNLEIPVDRLLAQHRKDLAAQPRGLHAQLGRTAPVKTSPAAAASKDHPPNSRLSMSASSAAGSQTNEQRQLRVASPQGNSENSSPSSEQIKIRFWMWCNQRLSPINQRLLFSSLCSGQDWLLEWQLEQNPLIQWCLVDNWDEIQWWLYSTIADAHAPWNKTIKSSRIAQLFMWYCRKRLLFAKAGAICGHSYGFSQAPMHGWFQIWNLCFIARRSVSCGVFPPCMGWMCFCLKSWDLTEEQIVNSLWMLRLRDLSFWVFYSCFMA